MIKDLGSKYKVWSFDWVPRYANVCADAATKWARIHKCSMATFDSFECVLPSFVLNLVSAEKASGVSLL